MSTMRTLTCRSSYRCVQRPTPDSTARATFAAPARGPAHHMCERCPYPARAPWLFTCAMAGSETPIDHPLRSSTRTGRCAHTPSQPSPAYPHDRSHARACALRRSMFFKHYEKDVPGEFSGSFMVYKVMQDLACTGAARGAGAAQEQRPVGRPSASINQYLLAQPSPPSWPRGPMTC